MKTIRTTEKRFQGVLERIVRRGDFEQAGIDPVVSEIIADVRQRGDEAVLELTERFDGVALTVKRMRVSATEVRRAHRAVSRETLSLIEEAAARIRRFHEKQREESWFEVGPDGGLLGQLVTPLDRVGLYVPGGTAAYPSSVLMNAIPAQVAGVNSLAICTPAPRGRLNPLVLAAADLLGIDEIYRIGGAQAVAALACGTVTVKRVDKIVGPGNRYVAAAKRLVYGLVDIDMVAGPSEILVVADESADPVQVAADLLSQAEHDELALCVLVTESRNLATETAMQIQLQLDRLPRAGIANAALEARGLIVVTRSLDESWKIANAVAPEHLEVLTADPLAAMSRVRHAGSVFIGPYTPEAIGDYIAGPNHVLPTGGTARFSSTLGVQDFLKRTNLVSFSRADLKKWGKKAARFARLEGLEAHARSVLSRKP